MFVKKDAIKQCNNNILVTSLFIHLYFVTQNLSREVSTKSEKCVDEDLEG